MSPPNANAYATALMLIGQYGEDAPVIAVLRAAEIAAIGDVDGLAHWDDVIREIDRLAAPNSDPAMLN